MDITKLSDLELGRILAEQQEALSNSINNVRLLKEELNKRLEKAKNEKAIDAPVTE